MLHYNYISPGLLSPLNHQGIYDLYVHTHVRYHSEQQDTIYETFVLNYKICNRLLFFRFDYERASFCPYQTEDKYIPFFSRESRSHSLQIIISYHRALWSKLSPIRQITTQRGLQEGTSKRINKVIKATSIVVIMMKG